MTDVEELEREIMEKAQRLAALRQAEAYVGEHQRKPVPPPLTPVHVAGRTG